MGSGEEESRATATELALNESGPWQPVPATISGYIQNLETNALLEFAARHRTVVRFERSVGEFVTDGEPLFSVRLSGPPKQEWITQLNRLAGIQSYRTVGQDPGFGIRLIVDIALKALSPGINDPTTATNCIDHLGRILRVLVRRRIPAPFRYQGRELCVIARGPTFERLVDRMFHEIRQNARGSVAVFLSLLRIIEKVAAPDLMAARRQVLWKHVRLIAEQAAQHISIPHDRHVIEVAVHDVARKLGEHYAQQPLLV